MNKPTHSASHQPGLLDKKVAIVVDPQIGLNAAESISPGVNTNQYQIRRWTDDVVAYSGTLKSWKNGATHTQSGDKGWWFDFSSVKTPGSYYIFDVKNGVGSYRFEIAATVYDDVLKQAGRMFYYQRIGMAKTAPYTNPKWTDAAAYVSANQDPYATSRFNKGVIATQRDLRGGWMPGIPINMCRRSNRLSYS